MLPGLAIKVQMSLSGRPEIQDCAVWDSLFQGQACRSYAHPVSLHGPADMVDIRKLGALHRERTTGVESDEHANRIGWP